MATEPSAAKRERPSKRWVKTRRVLRSALQNFLRADSLTVSASIAYHSLLAIFPLLLLLLGLAGLYVRRYELTGPLAAVLQHYLPIRADFIMQNLVGISHAYGRISILSFLLLLWSSSGVFLPLERALDRAWGVKQHRTWWQSRLLALEMALLLGCLILVSMALVGVNFVVRGWLGYLLGVALHPLAVFLYHVLAAGTSFAVAFLTFVILFERLPHRPMRFRLVFPGAGLTALLWAMARSLFIHLLPFFNYRQVYGSIGAVVALMTWAYISSAVVLFGAQVSQLLYGTLETDEPEATLGEAPAVTMPSGTP
jgi:membrane protein